MQMFKRVSHIFSKQFPKYPSSTVLFQLTRINPPPRILCSQVKWTNVSSLLTRYYHEELYSSDDEGKFVYKDRPISIKNLLYPDSDDPIINELNSAASVQEVFDLLQKYHQVLEYNHLAQIVLVLWDSQKMFCHVNVISNAAKVNELMNDYIEQLVNRTELDLLLELIERKLPDFDDESLSCTLMYLNKMGLSTKHPCLRSMVEGLKTRFTETDEVPMKAVSRYLIAVFSNPSHHSYFYSQCVISKVYDNIDKCETAEDFKLVTICLTKLNKIVSNDTLQLYKKKLRSLIDEGRINEEHITTLLRTLLFLNFPNWRNENSVLLSECMLMIKSKINLLTVYELLILYEILYKTQEPASILNEIQRCATRFFHQLEEDASTLFYVRLRLLKFIVHFSSPAQRPQFENLVRKYLDYSLNGENLLELYNTIFFLRNPERILCNTYWDKLLNVMEHDTTFRESNLLKICMIYLTFVHNIKYRYFKFEKRVNHWLEGNIETGVSKHVPSLFSAVAAFTVAFGNDVSIVNYVVNKLREEWRQYNYIDCLLLTRSLQVGREITKNPALKPRYVDSLNDTLNKCTEKELKQEMNLFKANAMLKTQIARNSRDEGVQKALIKYYKDASEMSSYFVKNISYTLLSLNALVPSVIDCMTDYITNNKDNILAYNAEDVGYLCYYFGYTPSNQSFFEAFKDVLLRDQEKINGLSYLQSCLSLCFFNAMTPTFVKQIFNSSFLEKLDLELVNCYSKEIYPIRVRHRLMELNRIVCIDYPECNIPWFHTKYVKEANSKASFENSRDQQLRIQVLEYLMKTIHPNKISTNVEAPYGYCIDFVVETDDSSKIAVLMMKPRAYTQIEVQLKGYYQLKVRHLEMFGYRVVFLDVRHWSRLVYGEDKVNYINKIMSADAPNVTRCEVNR